MIIGLFLAFFTTREDTYTQGTQNDHEVTVGEFRRFVQATGYRTTAEEFGWSAVALTNSFFLKVDNATWWQPTGGPKSPEDLPVTQVSWDDACAYCAWANSRLPTIAEWESKVEWDKPGNTLDTGTGKPVPSKKTDSRLGNVWEWTLEGATVGGSFLCTTNTCAGNTKQNFIHYPGKDAGSNNIGFRCKQTTKP